MMRRATPESAAAVLQAVLTHSNPSLMAIEEMDRAARSAESFPRMVSEIEAVVRAVDTENTRQWLEQHCGALGQQIITDHDHFRQVAAAWQDPDTTPTESFTDAAGIVDWLRHHASPREQVGGVVNAPRTSNPLLDATRTSITTRLDQLRDEQIRQFPGHGRLQSPAADPIIA